MIMFFWFLKEFGLKITLDNYLISFIKWFLGAKRIQITYMKKAITSNKAKQI